MMHDHGKSDRSVVPKKRPNKDSGAPRPAEDVEERDLTKGSPGGQTSLRTQGRERLQRALARVRHVATRDREARFTALWHHVYDIDRLRATFFKMKKDAAAGVDGQTWRAYAAQLEENLADLGG